MCSAIADSARSAPPYLVLYKGTGLNLSDGGLSSPYFLHVVILSLSVRPPCTLRRDFIYLVSNMAFFKNTVAEFLYRSRDLVTRLDV